MRVIFFFCLVGLQSGSSYAGICAMSLNREACPGKEQAAFAPYDGLNPTFRNEFAASAAACSEKAKDASKIIRYGILKKITVSPTLDGGALPSVFTESPCRQNRAD